MVGVGPISPPASWAEYVYSDATSPQQPVMDEEDEELLSTYPEVALTLGERAEQGLGTVYVTSRRVLWVSSEQAMGYAIPFRDVVLHAVATDTSAFARPCIYAQLQGGFADEEYEAAPASEVPDEADVSLEMRLSPMDASALQ